MTARPPAASFAAPPTTEDTELLDSLPSQATAGAGRRVLMLLQNTPLPNDRRVWPECLALRDLGFEVVAVCPEGDEPAERETLLDGIRIHRFRVAPATGGVLSYLREYALTLVRMRRIVRRLARGTHFDAVHAANPPDFLLLMALALRRRGTKLIFDQHDLAPELYRSRFDRQRDPPYWATCIAERAAYRVADLVISTNESYRRVALTRGRKRPEQVFVVRNAPNLERFSEVQSDPSLKRGKPYLLVYHGVMAPQDGVEHALLALSRLKQRRTDWHAAIIGDGDRLPELRRMADELGLEDCTTFPGWLHDDRLLPYLATADVAISPDPLNELNNVSTLIKIVEYMALGIPIVSYDLVESRVSAADAALYAQPNDEAAFAECIDTLLSDQLRRARMGDVGRARVWAGQLSWEHSAARLRDAYSWLLGPAQL